MRSRGRRDRYTVGAGPGRTLDHAEQLRCLQGVGEDLQAPDLLPLPAPDVHEGRLRGLVTLLQLRVAEDNEAAAGAALKETSLAVLDPRSQED